MAVATPSRSHVRVKLEAPVHAPSEQLSDWPGIAEPLIRGSAVLAGLKCVHQGDNDAGT